MDYTEKDYLNEVNNDKKLKELKNQLKQLVFRLNRETQRKEKLEIEPKQTSKSVYGSVGIDINADHIATAEIDAFGNLVKQRLIRFIDLKIQTKENMNVIVSLKR